MIQTNLKPLFALGYAFFSSSGVIVVGQALYKSLKNLVSVDKELNEVISAIKKTEDILKKDIVQIPLLKSDIEKSEKKSFDKKINLDLLELEAKTLKIKELEKKDKLEKITNPKEYKAIEKEAKAIELKTLEIDSELIKAWHKLETTEKEDEQNKLEKEDKIKQLEEGIVVQEKALVDQKSKEKKLNKKREEALKDIPQDWLNRYERMRHKVEDPIVPVSGSACSACYYTVLRQDMSKLKQSGVLLCRNCYRFLYYDIEEEEEAKQESF